MNATDKTAETPQKKVQQAMSSLGTPTPKSGSHVSPHASGGQNGMTPADKGKGKEHHIRIHNLEDEGGSGFVVTHHKSKDDHQPTEVHAIEDVRGLKKHIADHYGEGEMDPSAPANPGAAEADDKKEKAEKMEKGKK